MLPRLAELPGAVVFPVLHGEAGEDGALREVLALLGVPFVGSTAPPAGSRSTSRSPPPWSRTPASRTPHQVALPHEIFRELGAAALVGALADQVGFPMMVKPSRGGSALGASKVSRPEELPSAMVGAYAYGPVAVVEEFVAGTEVAVAVVDRGDGPSALPAVEIRPDSGVYDYTSRYTAGATRFLCPAEVDPVVTELCGALALRVHEVLGLRDLSRTDLIIRRDDEPIFLEVNVSPGMTETSSVPLAIEAAGWSLGKMCADLVRVAAARTALTPTG